MTTPNTLLAAARLAYPDRPWRYFCGEVYWEDEFGLTQTVFSLTNPADAYALWKALAERGIVIIFCGGLQRWTVDIPGQITIKMKLGDSDIDAMLKTVETLETLEAMT